jgi:hypothetical protein
MACEIDLKSLQKATDMILDHVIKDLGIEKLQIEDNGDFYWDVPTDRLHAVKQAQPQLDVGRLSDDWDFVSKMLHDKAPVALVLIHIAPLLRHLGEKVGQ